MRCRDSSFAVIELFVIDNARDLRSTIDIDNFPVKSERITVCAFTVSAGRSLSCISFAAVVVLPKRTYARARNERGKVVMEAMDENRSWTDSPVDQEAARLCGRAAKRNRVLGVLDAAGCDSVLLESHSAVAWYLEGARTHVSLAGDPVLAVKVSKEGDEIFAFDNEADRLSGEELLAQDAANLTRVRWDASLVEAAGFVTRERVLASALRSARASLLPAELARYRGLGREVAEVLTDTVLGARPDDIDQRVAAEVSSALIARGIDPLVVLVGGESRVQHRHPLPAGVPLGRRAMLVACGRRHGLIANATRWVDWSGGSSNLDERIRTVEAAYLDATVPGSTLAQAFLAGTRAYAVAGFDKDEWMRHHQGGAAGYAGRDPRATTTTTDVIQVDQAFAWNPSVPGSKIEDTVVVRDGHLEVLTLDGRWPATEVCGRVRPVAYLR
jgi:Xaa-Pro aminopeptidase